MGGRTSSVSLQSQYIAKIGLNGELETASVVMSQVLRRWGVGLLQSAYRANI